MSVVLRFATAADAAEIAAIYAPIVRDTPISFEVEPPHAAEIERRIASVTAFYPWLVCERSARVAGYAYASQHHVRAAYQWSADVSVYIHEDHRGRGVGRALYSALFDILRAQQLFRAYAGITLPNAASVGLHEALGFTALGVYHAVGFKLGRWHDVGWWELALQAGEPLAAPVPVTAVPGDRLAAAFERGCAP